MEISDIPFNAWIGISADGETVRLDPAERHLNHLQTVHAAVVFAVAEAAAGQLLGRRFRYLSDSFLVVLRGSAVKYRNPASSGHPLIGQGEIDEDEAESFGQTLNDRSRALIPVKVCVVQNNIEILSGTFTWFAKKL